MGTPSNPLRVVTPVLLLWAVVATVLALRPEAPPGAHREPGAEPEDAAALREEVVALRAEVADLRATQDETTSQTTERDEPAVSKAPTSFGDAADRLLAEFRELRDTGRDPERLHEILLHLARSAEKDRAILLAVPDLLREALDEEGAGDIAIVFDNVSRPDPGGPTDLKLRSELRAVLADETDLFRRLYAADLLLSCVHPTSRDFGIVLEVARQVREPKTRDFFLGTLGNPALRSVVRPEQEADLLRILRAELPNRAATLARWSDSRADFDLLREHLRREPTASLIHAFAGGIPLTKGREDEARAALVAVVADDREKDEHREFAARVLGSLHPLDADTKAVIESFRAEAK
ncbi:MAG: hypothetical protein ABFS86_15950 [Planctomycetota bacterium]